jgi:hypothetical protein
MIYTMDTANTVKITYCRSCGAPLLATYKFCRLCGECQIRSVPDDSVEERQSDQSCKADVPAQMQTRLMQGSTCYRSISGSILSSIAQNASTSFSSKIKGRTTKKVVSMLIAIPLWLLIVMLSPFDALQASNEITGEITGHLSDN